MTIQKATFAISIVLFVVSMATLVAALAVTIVCAAAGRPDSAYVASNVLAPIGIVLGMAAMALSTTSLRSRRLDRG